MPRFFALLALAIVSLASANPFRWTTFTSGSSVRNILVSEDKLWLGTSGGLVLFDPATAEFDVYTNTRGLAMNAAVGLGTDAQGWIWIVAPDGRITRLNPESGQTKIISDLRDEIFEVSSIVTVGEEVFLGANNGIYRFAYYPIVANYRVSERVRVLGSFPTGAAVQDMLALDGFLYAATVSGLARAPLTSDQFSAPATWTNYTTANGLPANNVFGLGSQGASTLWVTTGSATVSFNGTSFSAPVSTPQTFLQVTEHQSDMFAASDNLLYKLVNQSWQSLGLGQPGISSLAEFVMDGHVVLAVGIVDKFERPGGLRFYQDGELTPTIAPAGIGGSTVNSLAYDALGNLWASTGNFRNGVSKFSNDEWEAFANSDELTGDFWTAGPTSIAADKFGGMWFGSNGGGVLHARDGEFYSYNPTEPVGFDQNGPRLANIIGSNDYCEARVGRMPTGEILITNLFSSTVLPIAVVTNDWLAQGDHPEPWVYYVPDSTPTAQINWVGEIFGDPFGRIFAGASRGGNFTFVCDPRGTLADTSDDIWASYDPVALQDAATTCFEDISREVLAFAVDQQNYLWVGTPTGAYYSQGGLTRNVTSMRFICLFDLPVGNRVNAIHVDSQDNKWFGTDQGVAVLDPSFTWIHVFQTSSSIDYASDLASNGIQAITSNPVTGEVWIGTIDGLSRLQTPYVSRKPTLDKVTPYPNPFHADGSQSLFIDANELGGRFDELRVFTLGGRLVRELTWSEAISGGWNGKNSEGHFVAGGVYLLVATTADGHSATGKVAVLGR